MIDSKYLAADHKGMKINAKGALTHGQAYAREEMYTHLREMAGRFYAGEISVVDEFLQLYCLDDNRPTATPKCQTCDGNGYSRKPSLGDQPCEDCDGTGTTQGNS